jgi:hypothetical protein
VAGVDAHACLELRARAIAGGGLPARRVRTARRGAQGGGDEVKGRGLGGPGSGRGRGMGRACEGACGPGLSAIGFVMWALCGRLGNSAKGFSYPKI